MLHEISFNVLLRTPGISWGNRPHRLSLQALIVIPLCDFSVVIACLHYVNDKCNMLMISAITFHEYWLESWLNLVEIQLNNPIPILLLLRFDSCYEEWKVSFHFIFVKAVLVLVKTLLNDGWKVYSCLFINKKHKNQGQPNPT